MTNNLRCNHCDKQFRYESEKKRHELSHSPHFKCDVCNKKFSFNSALKRHVKQHQRTEKALCKECGRSFRDESLLKRHIKYAHKGKFICKKCNAEFHSEVALNIHDKIHRPKAERKYCCRYDGCDKTFNFPHHLKHHEMTHTDIKQYYCNICKKGFIQLHHLKSHMKTHEPETWLQCPEINCKKKFPTEYSKRRHLLHTHKIKCMDIKTGQSVTQSGQKDSDMDMETVLCTTCGEIMDPQSYEGHVSICSSLTENHAAKAKVEEQCTEIIRKVDSPHINDCKSVLGSCIVSGDSTESCLCEQIKTTVEDYCDTNIIPDDKITSAFTEPNLQPPELFEVNENGSVKAACESCACGGNLITNIDRTHNLEISLRQQNMDIRNCPKRILSMELPDIEYKFDGSIKLKETFDVDIKIFESNKIDNKYNEKAECNSAYKVPFNSCKAVLGKCIVSGNGTISEECLCARMLVDDDQVTAEEIDEITPHPTISSMNVSVI